MADCSGASFPWREGYIIKRAKREENKAGGPATKDADEETGKKDKGSKRAPQLHDGPEIGGGSWSVMSLKKVW